VQLKIWMLEFPGLNLLAPTTKANYKCTYALSVRARAALISAANFMEIVLVKLSNKARKITVLEVAW
jgi:hypothetical protein